MKRYLFYIFTLLAVWFWWNQVELCQRMIETVTEMEDRRAR